MNVLTKVFVVLMTILSVVLVSLVVPFVANTENYKDQVAAAQAEADAARANATVAASRATASQTELNNQIDEQAKIIASLRATNSDVKNQLATTQGDLERTRADLVRTQSDIANLTASNKQLTDIQIEREKELTGRRDDTTKQAKQIIELEAAVNDQASATATLRRQLRLAQENLVKTQEELAKANAIISNLTPDQLAIAQGGSVSADGKGDIVANPAINAQVSDVRQAGDVSLVQLNIGSSAGVRERMVFQIHREGQYIGTVAIMTVDEQASVGRVRLVKNGATIKAGDFARSGPIN